MERRRVYPLPMGTWYPRVHSPRLTSLPPYRLLHLPSFLSFHLSLRAPGTPESTGRREILRREAEKRLRGERYREGRNPPSLWEHLVPQSPQSAPHEAQPGRPTRARWASSPTT